MASAPEAIAPKRPEETCPGVDLPVFAGSPASTQVTGDTSALWPDFERWTYTFASLVP